MKKIAIVLLMALALVSMATAEVMVSGEFEYGFMTNADEFSGKFDKIELDINADIDEYNSFSMELEDDLKSNTGMDAAMIAGDGVPMNLNWATVTTDWGMLLDLPIGVSTTLGWDGIWVGDQLYATGWGYENYFGFYTGQEAFGQLNLVFSDMIDLKTAVNFDPDQAGLDEYDYVAELHVNVAPAKVNLSYVNYDGIAYFGYEAVAGMDVAEGMRLDAGTSLEYNIDAETYKYGFGVGFGVADAKIGVSFNGDDVDALKDLGVDVSYAINDSLSATVASLFEMSDAYADAYLGTEVSLTYAAGAVSYTAGYAITDGYGVSYNSETSLADGGFFMAMALDF